MPELDWNQLTRWFERTDWGEVLAPYFVAALVLVVGYVLARLFARIAARLARRTGSEHMAAIVRQVVFYTGLFLAFFTALAQFDIKFGTLLTTAGLLTVAIGFAAQTSVSNVISGIFLFIDRPFSINDTVKIDQTVGTIIAIDLLSTKVRTFDNLVVRIPNEALLKSTIINYSLYEVRRIEQLVSVAYSTDLRHAVEVLTKCLEDHPMILDEPRPFVLVDLLADSGVVLVVRAWCLRVDFVQTKSELTLSIKESLDAAGIEIPFPQRVVHMRGGE